MADRAQTTVTRLLGELRSDNPEAFRELFPLVYHELLELAHRQRRRWHGDNTMGTTALVHEAYLKLVDQEKVAAETRVHFFALAAKAMRHILCNYARGRQAKKRGGDVEKVSLADRTEVPDQLPMFSEEQAERLAALDVVLQRLEQVNPRRSQVVECRFFGGMTVDDTAAALGISPRTVKRDWAVAQAWLHREMNEANRARE